MIQEKKYPEIVREIHTKFNEAGDILLKEAQSFLTEAERIDKNKGRLLQKLGFINTKEAIEHKSFCEKEEQQRTLLGHINRLKKKYPKHKFISYKDVKFICEKYGLVMGALNLYKGFVPMKNLIEISDFKVDKEDGYYCGNRNELLICAPINDMKTEGQTLTGVLLHYSNPDPVVLQPISWTGGYLIVTAWGDEASDPLIKH